jgi:SAM-dependent methyltransferase
MKENKYDNEVFFKKYSEMNRSQNGLKGAGEWSKLQKVLPDFNGKHVLDLGCGYGWHCMYAAQNGAKYVLGTDISQKMLNIALKKNHHPNIEYQCIAMEDIQGLENSFDIVLSSLAFHYVFDYKQLIQNIHGWLKPLGYLVFSVEHPVFTAQGKQDWYYDDDGNIMHFPVDHYFYEGVRHAQFLGEEVIKYHRTLTTYFNTLLVNGFEILNIIEPQPPKDMMNIEGMQDEMRRPMMLIVLAQKK